MTLTPNQTQWLAALRSGDYPQGRRTLRSIDNRFCCLGVACELFNPEPAERCSPGAYHYAGKASTAPEAVREALGLRDEAGSPSTYAKLHALTDLNDDGMTFAQIADIIEANPEEYFL